MDTLDIIKDIKLDNEKERIKKAKIKKIFLTTLTIFILIITVIYLTSAYGVLEIIAGLLISDKLDNNFTTNYQQYTITFNPKTYQQLKNLYFSNLQHEFKACLSGTKTNNEYKITEITIPKIFSQSVFHVTSSGCQKETLISLHSHPYKRCIFSEQDINSYKKLKKTNPEALFPQA